MWPNMEQVIRERQSTEGLNFDYYENDARVECMGR